MRVLGSIVEPPAAFLIDGFSFPTRNAAEKMSQLNTARRGQDDETARRRPWRTNLTANLDDPRPEFQSLHSSPISSCTVPALMCEA